MELGVGNQINDCDQGDCDRQTASDVGPGRNDEGQQCGAHSRDDSERVIKDRVPLRKESICIVLFAHK